VPIFGYVLTAFAAYLMGSIPTGFLVGKAKGIDIRKIGSGNIGATNVFRYFGTVAGLLVLLADALKGLLAVVLAPRLSWLVFGVPGDPLVREWLELIAGFTAILGHNYTCWLRFKGGKGIATSAGVLIALVPYALLIIFGIWIVVFGLTRFVSLGSICASAALPFATWITGGSLTFIVITGIMAALAIYKHKANIQRLLNGTENRIAFKSRVPASQPPDSTA